MRAPCVVLFRQARTLLHDKTSGFSRVIASGVDAKWSRIHGKNSTVGAVAYCDDECEVLASTVGVLTSSATPIFGPLIAATPAT
jgi:hypothetical protein